MTLGEFRRQTKGLSDDLELELYSEKYNDSTQPIRLEFDTEGYVELIINDDRWCLGFEPEQKLVLDKIKTEIEQVADEEQKHDKKWAIGLRYALKIIDKYR